VAFSNTFIHYLPYEYSYSQLPLPVLTLFHRIVGRRFDTRAREIRSLIAMLEYLPWKKKAKEPTAVSAVLTHNEAVEKPTTPTPTATATTATTTTTATPESPRPVLSHHDEEFLKKTLEDTDDQPVVILQGSGSTTPSISPSVAPLATPPSETQAVANESDGAEVKGKSKKKEKEEKAAEWKEGIRNRWEGLRRSASSAVDKRKGRGKVEEGDVKGNGKGKEGEKERLEVKEGLLLFLDRGDRRVGADLWIIGEKSEEDELRRALDGLNLAAQGVWFSLPLSIYSF